MPLRNSHDQQRALAVLPHRFAERVREGELGGDEIELLLRHDADHPARRAVELGEDRLHRRRAWRCAVALELDLDRLAVAVLGDLLELDLRVDRLRR